MAETLAKQIDFLLSGVPEYANGTATFYFAGTGNLKTVYLDKNKIATATNPYQLDTNGRAVLFGSGTYKVVLLKEDGTGSVTLDYLTYIDPFEITKAANLSGGNATTLQGSIPYQSDVDTTAMLAPNVSTTKKFLTQSGTGVDGDPPAWATIAAGDVPTLNQNTTGSSASCTGNAATATTAAACSGNAATADVAAKVTFRGALVYNTSGATGADVPWASEAYDTDGIHDIGANTPRLTVPAGVTNVMLSSKVYFTSTGAKNVRIHKNNSGVYVGSASAYSVNTGSEDNLNVRTPVLSVVAGDYFTVYIQEGTVGSDLNGDDSWFAMEIVE